MKPLSETHQTVDTLQIDRTGDRPERSHTRNWRDRHMPSKKAFGYGETAITLEEWKAVYGS